MEKDSLHQHWMLVWFPARFKQRVLSSFNTDNQIKANVKSYVGRQRRNSSHKYHCVFSETHCSIFFCQSSHWWHRDIIVISVMEKKRRWSGRCFDWDCVNVLKHNSSEDRFCVVVNPSSNHCLSLLLHLKCPLFFFSFVLSSKLCFYWRPIWIALQNVIRHAVDESILPFNDWSTWYAFYMALYTFNGNQWKANNTGSQWAECLTDGCGRRLFVNTHSSVLSRAALYCVRLDECGCKGGSLRVRDWLTHESVQSRCYILPLALSS